MSNDHDTNVAQTYLALRLAMVLLVALLFLSVVFQIIEAQCLQRSISAYYYTSTRPLFVGALCAIGASLIIYRGNTDTENVLLDFSGFLAFIVAFVPTQIDRTCDPSNVPTVAAIGSAITNNVWSALAIGLVATVVAWWRLRSRGVRMSNTARLSLIISVVALLAGVVFFAFWPDEFRRVGHDVSAIALFIGFVAVVLVNAWGFEREYGEATVKGAATNRYAVVAFAMLASAIGLVLAGTLIDAFDHWVFFLEAVLILEFAVFWGIQTAELRGNVTR